MDLRPFFTGKSWWGKLIGSFFGYLVAGPVGALFGIFIGNFFDQGLTQHFSKPHWHYHAEKRRFVQKAFFETTFLVMGYLAKVDGRVSEREIHMAKVIMQEMGLNVSQTEEAKRFFRAGKDPSFNLTQTLSSFVQNCRDNPELLKLFLDIQYRAAQIEGLSQSKMDVLNHILQHFGLAPLHEQYRFYEDFGRETSSQSTYQNRHSSHQYQRPPPRTSSSPSHAYAILEVPPSASKHEVKQAYRRLMSRNHPDKLIAQGLPEEMIKMANDKTQKILKAYEQICAAKGW